jgi:hypothetical protein
LGNPDNTHPSNSLLRNIHSHLPPPDIALSLNRIIMPPRWHADCVYYATPPKTGAIAPFLR